MATTFDSNAAVLAAEANIKQTQASLDTVRLNLKNSVVLSPVDGIVIEHGNQYDYYCSFRYPMAPFGRDPREIQPTLGSLTARNNAGPGASFVLERGAKVSHFNYFANERGVQTVTSARAGRVETINGDQFLLLANGQQLESANDQSSIKISDFDLIELNGRAIAPQVHQIAQRRRRPPRRGTEDHHASLRAGLQPDAGHLRAARAAAVPRRVRRDRLAAPPPHHRSHRGRGAAAGR